MSGEIPGTNTQSEQKTSTPTQSVIFPGMDVWQCVKGAVCAEVPSGWQLGTGRGCVWKGLGGLGEAYFGAMNIKKNRGIGAHLNKKLQDKE